MSTTIYIGATGNIYAVYSDLLNRLGKMQINRASSVEFNHNTQEWEARSPILGLLCSNKNRDEVIREEVRQIEEFIESNI